MSIRDDLRTLVVSLGPLDLEELDDDTSLLEQGALDSTGLVEIQLYIEDSLGRELVAGELHKGTLLTISAATVWLEAALSVERGA